MKNNTQTPQDELREIMKNQLIEVMYSKVESIIGEDGLTVWDFAELRDSILDEAMLPAISKARQEGMRRQCLKLHTQC